MYVVLIVIRGQKVKELVSSKSVISQHSCPYQVETRWRIFVISTWYAQVFEVIKLYTPETEIWQKWCCRRWTGFQVSSTMSVYCYVIGACGPTSPYHLPITYYFIIIHFIIYWLRRSSLHANI